MKKALVTGAAGFIGFHLAKRLLEDGWTVVGVDNLSDYYDVRIKEKRLDILKASAAFRFEQMDIADHVAFAKLIADEQPDELVHLAAQAGVRYSLTNPWAYMDANYAGTLSVLEAVRHANMPRLIYASSSSVYGGNEKQPFAETDPVDKPLSLYGASKRANELMAYSYTNLYGFETVGLRFFTVYGTWSRPDLALFKFAKNIAQGLPIDVYNNGHMKRNFTYIDDVVDAITALLAQTPSGKARIYNLGGSEATPLLRFIELIEAAVGKKAIMNMLPLQPGDVPETIADCSLAERDFGYRAQVSIEEGIQRFAEWFKANEAFALSLVAPKQ
jgi:UDP-glucuronate 4-epimerase